VEQLKKPHQSYLRNPLVAKVFYLAGYIEQYGSGTVRMVEWMKEAGLPEPEYKEELGGFSVYFCKDVYTEENLRKMELNERQIKAATPKNPVSIAPNTMPKNPPLCGYIRFYRKLVDKYSLSTMIRVRYQIVGRS